MKPDYTVARGSLEGIEAFLRVAARRNFRQAAADLGITPSAMSQAIQGLEARVGVALFTRTTRSVGLTEAGERLLERAQPAFEEMVAAGDAARRLAERPSGLLRLTAPRGVVPLLLQPLLASFAQACPEVVVEIVASPAYLDPRGRPQRPEDLHQHACVRMRRANGAIGPWRLLDEGGRTVDWVVSGPLVVNDYPTMLTAALGDVGLAQLPEPVAAADLHAGRLEAVLPAHAPTSDGVFLYHPGRRQVLPKLRAFIDHVRSSALSSGDFSNDASADSCKA